MGMLTGIRVITLLELAFWIVRFVCRYCFTSYDTQCPEEGLRPKKKRIDEIERIEKELEKKIENRFSVMEKTMSLQLRPWRKVSKNSKWPSFKIQ